MVSCHRNESKLSHFVSTTWSVSNVAKECHRTQSALLWILLLLCILGSIPNRPQRSTKSSRPQSLYISLCSSVAYDPGYKFDSNAEFLNRLDKCYLAILVCLPTIHNLAHPTDPEVWVPLITGELWLQPLFFKGSLLLRPFYVYTKLLG
jgi:hypothetical protein